MPGSICGLSTPSRHTSWWTHAWSFRISIFARIEETLTLKPPSSNRADGVLQSVDHRRQSRDFVSEDPVEDDRLLVRLHSDASTTEPGIAALASSAGVHQQVYRSVQKIINWRVARKHHVQRTIHGCNPNCLLAFESVQGRRSPESL
jgi:hypothetical protein